MALPKLARSFWRLDIWHQVLECSRHAQALDLGSQLWASQGYSGLIQHSSGAKISQSLGPGTSDTNIGTEKNPLLLFIDAMTPATVIGDSSNYPTNEELIECSGSSAQGLTSRT